MQPGFITGLSQRLQLFQMRDVRRIVCNDDIRLEDIGARKTALFLVISDDNASMQTLSSLMFSFLLKDLKEAYDLSLIHISKLNEKKAEMLAASCRAVLILDDFEKLLGNANIPRDVLDKIVDAYGDKTVEMAKNNAFQFVDVVGFPVSDKIALAAGMARNDARRIRAGVMESVRGVCKKTGCMCADTEAVLSAAYELLGNDVPAIAVQHGCETLCDSYTLVKHCLLYTSRCV